MILDICYHDKGPEQLQEVRQFTLYAYQSAQAVPELVVHFKAYTVPQRNIPLHTVKSFMVTND